ncbi:hydroxyethylthiazole kinase [Pseudahrensia aquimaris]|uniref:Hydroxyethylthiazole kinase n=1 Tax=Pseudahrensia aquimaris TaxID=744461 RepID=A0ABW3FGD5_9HYPH
MAQNAPEYTAEQIADCVARFRTRRPHVHCITNSVAQHFTANVLLAAGATPSMTIAPDEVESFVTMADALLINLGTMDEERKRAAHIAITAANAQSKPWALDPVFVQASKGRMALAQELLKHSPTLLRCNAGEAKALFGDTASFAAQHSEICIAKTGKTDEILQGNFTVGFQNGSPLMDCVTTMGCALNAVMISFSACEDDTALAACAALSLYNIAGEEAAVRAAGPGTFVPHFLDCLAELAPDTIAERVRFA